LILRVACLLVGLVLVGACQPQAPTRLGSASSASSGAPLAALTIYGAASLKGALDQLETSYEAGHPGTTLTISTDSSAALATQVEQGAPADVFLSADVTNPKRLVDTGLADGDAVNFAGNLLTIVVPTDNPAGITTPADLAKGGVKVIAAGDDVPITKYARQVVDLLAKIPGYPAGFAAAYDANVVTKEDNVKAVVAKIELGEGDAAIVYVTDATASGKVKSIAVPAGANVAATYAGVVVKGSPNVAAAHAFLAWMTGAEAHGILAQLGFSAPAS
jgi:molybdate transport system substrate-binding protein